MQGILRCSLYAFGPNRAHYCGPDANQELAAYLSEGMGDPGLELLLREFRTMYPYLRLIAYSNGIADPFDERVVEAYWLGNELLENVGKQRLYRHMRDEQGMHKRLGHPSYAWLEKKIASGALPHHSFHVLDVWRASGHQGSELQLPTLDACRVSWGKVISVDGPRLRVSTQPLVVEAGQLGLGGPLQQDISRPLTATFEVEQVRLGQMVSLHWGVACEVLSEVQLKHLQLYTLHHIKLANLNV